MHEGRGEVKVPGDLRRHLPSSPADPQGLLSTPFTLALAWASPLLLVLLYLVLGHTIYPAWVPFLTTRTIAYFFGWTLLFSVLWFALAYGAGRTLGVFLPFGFLQLVSRLPYVPKRVVVTPPEERDDSKGWWISFLGLFAALVFFEVVYLVGSQRRGVLNPFIGSSLRGHFFIELLFGGCIFGVLLAPTAPYFLQKIRLRVVDSLEFPFLWLTLMLLIIGGATAALYAFFPQTNGGVTRLLLSILIYAPSAWYMALGFSRARERAQRSFLERVRRSQGPWFMIGKMLVQNEGGMVFES